MTFGGRLTLASAQPVMSADVTSSTLYYAPHTGNTANGITFTSSSIDAIGLSLSLAGLAGNSIHKVFINSGGLYLGTPASGSLYGAGHYGAGTFPGHDPNPPLTRLNGVLVNSAVDAYLGSIQIDPDGGTCTAHFSYGASRRFGVWNAYNQLPILLKAGATTTGPYNVTQTPPGWGPVRGDSGNSLKVLTGLPQGIETSLTHGAYMPSTDGNTHSSQHTFAIGWDRSDLPASTWSSATVEMSTFNCTGKLSIGYTRHIPYFKEPFAGSATVYAIENGVSGNGYPVQAWTTERDCVLTAKWMG